MILKLNIFESLSRILYVQLNAEPELMMMKCTNSKLHIDSINISEYTEGMKSFLVAGKISVFSTKGESSPLCPCVLFFFSSFSAVRFYIVLAS